MRAALLALTVLTTAATAAQPVPVLTGEHPGFTRVVMDLPGDASWQLGRDERGYTLRFSPDPGTADLSQAFRRINTSRISRLSWQDETSELHIGLDCRCHARLIPDRPGLMILDIRDGPAPVSSLHEQPLPPISMPPLAPSPQPQRLPPVPFQPQTTELSNLGRTLLEGLSRGIGSGFLRTSRLQPEARESPAPSASLSKPSQQLAEAPAGQLRIHSLPSAGTGDPPASEVRCTEVNRLDIHDWNTGADPAAALADSRIKLASDRGSPDSKSLETAIRLHLALGLGAEARALLSLHNATAEEVQNLPLWRAMSHIIDADPETSFFTGMAGCDGPAALWALLSQPSDPLPPDLNETAVLAAFSALPPPLRRTFGPGLAIRFHNDGRADAALQLRNSTARVTEPTAAALLLLNNRFSDPEIRPEVRTDRLRDVIRTSTTQAAPALTELAQTELEQTTPPDAALVLALEAMVPEKHENPEKAALALALAKAHILSGAPLSAFEAHEHSDAATQVTLWRLLAERGSDAALVETTFHYQNEPPDILPPRLQQQIGIRLARLGFGDAARAWLLPLNLPETQEGLAEAALAQRDGRAALRYLAGRTTAQAAEIRAQALELLGDGNEAAVAWLEAGKPDEANRVNFITGSASVAADSLPHAYPGLATALAPPPAPEPGTGLLAQARDNLARSAETRRTLMEILNAGGTAP